jgi:uncharacterized protein YceK
MRKTMLVVVPIVIAILTLLVIEGVASIANWKQADRSLVYGVYAARRDRSHDSRHGFRRCRNGQRSLF